MRYEVTNSTAIKTVEFSTDNATVDVVFTSNPKNYTYKVTQNFDEVKNTIVNAIQDVNQSVGSRINALIRNETLQVIS